MDEKDKKNQKKQEAAVQAELEQQLRDLGVGVNELKDTVGDAFRHGFEGREDELGRQVNDVASGVTAVLNSVVGEVANAFQDAMDLERGAGREERAGRRREREHRRWQQREARRNARADQSGESAPYDYSSRWQTGPGRISWGRYRSDWAAPAPEGEGGYVKAKYNFVNQSTSVNADDNGYINNSSSKAWFTGNDKASRFSVTGGAMFRIILPLYIYAGMGYGTKTLAWEMADGNWAEASDHSVQGIASEVGLIYRLQNFAISAGVENTQGKCWEANVGIAVMF